MSERPSGGQPPIPGRPIGSTWTSVTTSSSHSFKRTPTDQPGDRDEPALATHPTAPGWWWVEFKDDGRTLPKGRRAVEVVEDGLEPGAFTFWLKYMWVSVSDPVIARWLGPVNPVPLPMPPATEGP